MEAEAAKDSVFDEGFVELEVPEDEAMEVASSATEQEVDEVLGGPKATVYFKDSNPGLQGRGIPTDEVEQIMQSEAYQRRIATCHLCGQCWYDNKFRVGCHECGGFPLQRACPVCDGQCGSQWTRNIKLSHSFHEAHWDGSCALPPEVQHAFQLRKLTDSSEETLSEGLQDLSTS
ncbi:protein pinocchio-like [Pomacea canaliculata]|uniref:protein pinocchio-like n=1 Tax=Pomacea canaliculata TaxID=400727 RepID=UPI000D72B7E3|nr:protein pinocchio-like [Pomacea canaliculata]XP_025090006.1 protein pinocchio-like [Pomacea canaliculata]